MFFRVCLSVVVTIMDYRKLSLKSLVGKLVTM